MVEDEFVKHESEKIRAYYLAKASLTGFSNVPSLDKFETVVRTLCEIAEVEGNASDAGIQVFINPNTLALEVRPKVFIQKKKDEDEYDD